MTKPERTPEAVAADWLARRDGAGLSASEEAALQEWLAASPAHRVAFLRLQTVWEETVRLRALAPRHPPRPLHAPWSPRPAHTYRSAPGHRHTPLRRLAAASVFLVALLFPLARPPTLSTPPAAYQSDIGHLRSLRLADGSRVTLSSDSRIVVHMTTYRRDVHLLRGEAIFTVAKAPERPFTVHAHGYRAVAVGTRFAVRRDASALRVVVTEGTVRLEATGGNDRALALLPANSLVLAGKEGVLMRTLPPGTAEDLLEWQSGWLVFHSTPLAEAASEFNRYNTRKLVVGDAATGQLSIGGSFRWDNLDGFVRLLQAGFPVRAKTMADGRILLLQAR